MSEKLFLNTIRYLNDLFLENKLTPEQITRLAEFAAEIENPAKAVKPLPPEKTDETIRILHEIFPETGYSPRPREL